MTGRLKGKRALLFGASGKLGRAVALLFAQEGAQLVLVSRSPGKLRDLYDQIASISPVILLEADSSSEDGCRGVVESGVKAFGGLDILYYGASSFKKRELFAHQITEQIWDDLLGSNLRGAFFACKHSLPVIADDGGGSAIIMGGTAGDWLGSNVAYAAAKAGVLGLTRRLAREWRNRNVRVNAILPAHVPKDMGALWVEPVVEPLTGTGKPEDIAYLALFLASQESRYLTGVNVPVDGGRELFLDTM